MAVSAPTNDTVLLDFNSAADGTTIVKSGGRLTVGTTVSGTSPFADGSLAAPSITFASDLGLGFFRIGADIIGGATAGVLGFRYGGASQTAVLGAGAFASRTAGTGGTAVGHGAGAALTNTANVTALGANANASLTSANGSTSVGSNSQATTDATSLGFGALALGTRSVAIGAGAGGGTGTQGADNVVIGPFAFDGNKTNPVTGVVAIGVNALGSDLTGVAAVNSVAVGSSALAAQSSGVGNTAMGFNAGTAISTGSNNTAVGNLAGSLLSIGSSNAFLGRSAGANVQTGSSNVYVGSTADTSGAVGGVSNNVGIGAASVTSGSSAVGIGASLSTTADNTVVIGANAAWAGGAGGIVIGQSAGSTGMGINNIAIGIDCLDGAKTNSPTGIVAIGPLAMRGAINVAACNTTAVGFSALALQQSTGANNVAVGFQAGDSLTTATQCVFIGADADTTSATSVRNTVIGASATAAGANNVALGATAAATGGSEIMIGFGTGLGSGTHGFDNIAIGRAAFAGNKSNSPTGCIAIGLSALTGALSTAASNNTAIGFSALTLVTSGTNNTAVGHNAGSTNLTTGSNNTLLGSGASVDAAGRAGTVVLGQGAAGTADNGLFFRTATLAQTGGLPMRFDTANGRAGPDTSSIRFKTDVTLAPYDGSLSKLTAIDKIRVIEFKSKTAEHDDPILGVIAEEAAEHVHPSLIARDDHNDVVGIDYSHLSCMLLQEIQFLRREVAKLKLNPLPALPAYVPVREQDIYPPKRRGDDNLMAAQKAQGKEARKNRKASHAVDDIEDEPEKEAEIMAKYNPDMQSRIRAEQEKRALAQAQAEAEEQARLEAQAAREAEEAEAESEVKEE